MSELRSETIAVLFADARGYSKLTPFELKAFLASVLPSIAEHLDSSEAFSQNSWGDGVVAFFRSARLAARCALKIREEFASEPTGRTPHSEGLGCADWIALGRGAYWL